MSHTAKRLLVGLVVLTVATTSGTIWWLQRSDDLAGDQTISAAGAVTHGRVTVTISNPKQIVTLSAPNLSVPAAESLGAWLDAGVAVGVPLEVSTEAKLDGKARISKTYAEPLPDDAAVTLAYYDKKLGEWSAVPTTLSSDRRTAMAEVDHLSVWDDFVATGAKAKDAVLGAAGKAVKAGGDALAAMRDAAGAAISTGADAIYYTAAKVFDKRVDPPSCNGATPAWVDQTVFAAFAPNGPVHWCSGRDEKDANVLEMKARINRGYGFTYRTSVKPKWSYNSGDTQDLLGASLDALTQLDDVIAGSVRSLLSGGKLAGPGQEISFGFSKGSVTDPDTPVITLTRPSPGLLTATVLSQMITAAGVAKAEGTVAAVIFVASCGRDVTEAGGDAANLARAVATCMSSDKAKRAVASTLGEVLLARPGISAREAGKAAGAAVGRLSVAVALAKPTLTTASYVVDTLVQDSLEARVALAASASTGTKVNVIYPFEADDTTLKPGWTKAGDGAPDDYFVDCTYGQRSPNGVSPGTYSCGTTADSTSVCWLPPTDSTDQLACIDTLVWPEQVLFYRNATNVSDMDPAELQVRDEPLPFAVRLVDGTVCRYRIGGATGVGGGPSDSIVAYLCDFADGRNFELLFDDQPWFDKRADGWYILGGAVDDPEPAKSLPAPSRVKVSEVWFVEGPKSMAQ